MKKGDQVTWCGFMFTEPKKYGRFFDFRGSVGGIARVVTPHGSVIDLGLLYVQPIVEEEDLAKLKEFEDMAVGSLDPGEITYAGLFAEEDNIEIKITDSPFWTWKPKMWTTSGGRIDSVRYRASHPPQPEGPDQHPRSPNSTIMWWPSDSTEYEIKYLSDFEEQPDLDDSATQGVVEFDVLEPLGLSLSYHDILDVYFIIEDCTGRTPELVRGTYFPKDSKSRGDALRAAFATLQGAKKVP